MKIFLKNVKWRFGKRGGIDKRRDFNGLDFAELLSWMVGAVGCQGRVPGSDVGRFSEWPTARRVDDGDGVPDGEICLPEANGTPRFYDSMRHRL